MRPSKTRSKGCWPLAIPFSRTTGNQSMSASARRQRLTSCLTGRFKCPCAGQISCCTRRTSNRTSRGRMITSCRNESPATQRIQAPPGNPGHGDCRLTSSELKDKLSLTHTQSVTGQGLLVELRGASLSPRTGLIRSREFDTRMATWTM